MQRKLLMVPALFLLVLFSCDRGQEFNYQKKWDWAELESKAPDSTARATVQSLKKILSLNEARFILKQLDRLNAPRDIHKLAEIEKQQNKWGGSFYGFIPDRFKNPKKIPLPEGLSARLKCARYLSRIRAANLKIIEKPNLQYPLQFKQRKFPRKDPHPFPKELMSLEIKTAAVGKVLDYYHSPDPGMEQAKELAAHPVFTAMLKHRRQLGYIPEPLPHEEDLAHFIYYSASRDPLPMIWKWLNPWNYFGFADLYIQQDKFRNLIDTLEQNRAMLEAIVLGKIMPYLPDKQLEFREQLGFGINFGVRSWATHEGLGSNLVQIKDDYQTLIETVTHETFHRFQLQLGRITPARQDKSPREFEDLTYWDFKQEADQKFYKTLAYIMLEGSASFISTHYSTPTLIEGVKFSRDLLDQSYVAIYETHRDDLLEQMLNMGLESNGPYYQLGFMMSRKIINYYDKQKLGALITEGPVAFFQAYIHAQDVISGGRGLQIISDRVKEKIAELEQKMQAVS